MLPFEVKPTIQTAILELQDIVDTSCTDDELLDSHLSRFQIAYDEEGISQLSAAFVKHDHMLRAPQNCEYKTVEFENFTELNNQSVIRASTLKKELSRDLITYLTNRFSSFDEPIFKNMAWFDPKNWTDESTYGEVR